VYVCVCVCVCVYMCVCMCVCVCVVRVCVYVCVGGGECPPPPFLQGLLSTDSSHPLLNLLSKSRDAVLLRSTCLAREQRDSWRSCVMGVRDRM
jgi:hypothetical protein